MRSELDGLCDLKADSFVERKGVLPIFPRKQAKGLESMRTGRRGSLANKLPADATPLVWREDGQIGDDEAVRGHGHSLAPGGQAQASREPPEHGARTQVDRTTHGCDDMVVQGGHLGGGDGVEATENSLPIDGNREVAERIGCVLRAAEGSDDIADASARHKIPQQKVEGSFIGGQADRGEVRGILRLRASQSHVHLFV